MRAPFAEYREAVASYRANDNARFSRLRRSLRLSPGERALLSARNLFWSRRWKEAQTLLESASTAANPFLDGERCFLLASANFQQGRIERSAYWNLKAREHYTAAGDLPGAFLATHNLMVDFSRINNLVLAQAYFEEAQKLATSPGETLLLYRARACEESRARNYKEACSWLDRIFKSFDRMRPHDREVTCNVAADIYFRAGALDSALNALEQNLARNGRNRDRGRLLFERALIVAHRDSQPLGPVPSSVKGCGEFALKWELIRALQSGELERSEKLWTELMARVPGMFGKHFACLDASESDSAFFAAVRALRAPRVPAPGPLSGKLAKLHEVLSSTRSPIRKEELIERVWGVRYDPSWDSRLYKLVERARRSRLPILSRHRAYSLRTDAG